MALEGTDQASGCIMKFGAELVSVEVEAPAGFVLTSPVPLGYCIA